MSRKKEDPVIVPRFDAVEHTSYDSSDLMAIRSGAGAMGVEEFNQDENAIMFARQLDFVKARNYERKFPGMKGGVLVPTSTEVPEFAESVTIRMYDEVGMAKVISNYADDLPRTDVRAKERSVSVRTIGDAFGYNINELRASRAAGVGLDTKRGAAARRAIEEKMNRVVLRGDPDFGLLGLLTHPNVPELVLVNGDWAGADTTGDMILEDALGMVGAVQKQSRGQHTPNYMPLAPDAAAAFNTKRLSTGEIVGKWFREMYPEIVVEAIYECEGAGDGGTDIGLLYERSEENLRHELVMPFNQLPPQARNLEFVVPCMARTAGVIIDYPMAFVKVEGI